MYSDVRLDTARNELLFVNTILGKHIYIYIIYDNFAFIPSLL